MYWVLASQERSEERMMPTSFVVSTNESCCSLPKGKSGWKSIDLLLLKIIRWVLSWFILMRLVSAKFWSSARYDDMMQLSEGR